MQINDLFSGQTYLLVVAHPDDELYSCVLVRRLILSGKKVSIAFITSGDAGSNPAIREQEALKSAALVGIENDNVYFLRIPELQFPTLIKEVVRKGVEIIKENSIDFVIGQDYEGGHEGHDLASFCASEMRRIAGVRTYSIFPIYHGKPQERKGARFKSERSDFCTLALTAEEKELKKKVLEAHAGQKGHFDGMQRSSADYEDLLFKREVHAVIDTGIDYKKRPTEEVGYEFHRNGFSFNDFQQAIALYENS